MENIRRRIIARAFERKCWEVPKVPDKSRTPLNRSRASVSPVRAKSSEKLWKKSDPVVQEVQDPLSASQIQLPTEESETSRIKFSVKPNPVCLLMLESYIREVCNEIERTGFVCKDTLSRANIMVKALNDCTKAIPLLSIFFYNHARSILRDLSSMTDQSDFRPVLGKMIELVGFIAEKRYQSKECPVSKFQEQEAAHIIDLMKTGLLKKLSNLTVKNLNVFGKAMKTDPELKNLARAYLEFLNNFEDLGGIIAITSTPDKVVEASKRVPDVIENGGLHKEAVKSLKDELALISLDKLRLKGKSVGIFIYEFLTHTVKYFMQTLGGLSKSKKSPVGRSNSVKKARSERKIPKKITPKKEPQKSCLQMFRDPKKQLIFETIMQQDVNLQFRRYLMQVMERSNIKGLNEETRSGLLKGKERIVEDFFKRYSVDRSNLQRLSNEAVFLENLNAASRLMGKSLNN